MCTNWYPVPGAKNLEASEIGGLFRNPKTGRIRKPSGWNEINGRKVQGREGIVYQPVDGKPATTMRSPRAILSAKLGRPLEDWEQARHIDGDRFNNDMSNLEPGCFINNAIDDIVLGIRGTDLNNLLLAKERIDGLITKYETIN